MSKVHGIVYAYHSSPRLGDLTRYRTNASLPFCGRYRLIDFALSSLSNAGVHSVGVIMQRDYQSLLDHLGSGKAWDLSRRSGGLHLLPPVSFNNANALPNKIFDYVQARLGLIVGPADAPASRRRQRRARGSSRITSSEKIRAGSTICSDGWRAFPSCPYRSLATPKNCSAASPCARTARRTGSTPNVRRVPSMCRSPAR